MERVAIEQMVVKAAAGDEAAWRAVWDHVEDVLEEDAGRRTRFLGRPQRVFERHGLVRDVTERLRADGMGRLKLYLAMRVEQPAIDFDAWIRVLARAVRTESPVPGEPCDTTAIEIMRRAASQLPEPELSALELWAQSADYRDIARELDLEGVDGARRVVRRALERLREHNR